MTGGGTGTRGSLVPGAPTPPMPPGLGAVLGPPLTRVLPVPSDPSPPALPPGPRFALLVEPSPPALPPGPRLALLVDPSPPALCPALRLLPVVEPSPPALLPRFIPPSFCRVCRGGSDGRDDWAWIVSAAPEIPIAARKKIDFERFRIIQRSSNRQAIGVGYSFFVGAVQQPVCRGSCAVIGHCIQAAFRPFHLSRCRGSCLRSATTQAWGGTQRLVCTGKLYPGSTVGMISSLRRGLVARPVVVSRKVTLLTWFSPPWVDSMLMNPRRRSSPAE